MHKTVLTEPLESKILIMSASNVNEQRKKYVSTNEICRIASRGLTRSESRRRKSRRLETSRNLLFYTIHRLSEQNGLTFSTLFPFAEAIAHFKIYLFIQILLKKRRGAIKYNKSKPVIFNIPRWPTANIKTNAHWKNLSEKSELSPEQHRTT
jgi:hypothetical protein